MISFLFEQYGYYPKNIYSNEFMIDNWCFRLIEVDMLEIQLREFEKYLEVIRSIFGGEGAFIIKNREGKLISFYDGKKYVLISVCLYQLSMMDLNKMHCSLIEDKKSVDLSVVLKAWQEKVASIESEAVNSLKVDSIHYKNNIEIFLFCLGLAHNSIQYLSEIILDYGNLLKSLSVCHKRLKNLNSFDVFNPFNMIVDHPIRDLCELYKNDGLSFTQLIDLLKYYYLDEKVASVFIARLIYPSCVFDQLEDFMEKKNNSDKLFFNIEKELGKIKKVYLYLKSEYNLRPIVWLEN